MISIKWENPFKPSWFFFQIAELKAAQAPSTSAMRNALLDPAVNIIVSKLTQVKSIASTSIANY